jgi:hypothetical protein
MLCWSDFKIIRQLYFADFFSTATREFLSIILTYFPQELSELLISYTVQYTFLYFLKKHIEKKFYLLLKYVRLRSYANLFMQTVLFVFKFQVNILGK